MTAVKTNEIGREICEALGLPSGQVSAIDLQFHACDIVRATVQFAPDRDQLGAVMSILKRYELHEKSAEAVPVDEREEIATAA